MGHAPWKRAGAAAREQERSAGDGNIPGAEWRGEDKSARRKKKKSSAAAAVKSKHSGDQIFLRKGR
jgi:hypothetical protein